MSNTASWPTEWVPVNCVSTQKAYLWSSSRSYTSIGKADQEGTLYTSDGGCTPNGKGFRSKFPCSLSAKDCESNWYHVPSDISSDPFYGNCAGSHSYTALHRLTFQNPDNGLIKDIQNN